MTEELLATIEQLKEENKKLNEFKEKWEESMFYFKAQIERAEPKTARETEDLQKAKEIFEGLYREELSCLEEENKNLKERVNELEDVSKDYDLLSKDFITLGEENEKLKEEIKELEETLEHRDSILSIMYDLLRSDLSDYEQLCMIDVVIDVEVGNEPQNKLREELLDRFWKRDF